jgi:hypothetical protein
MFKNNCLTLLHLFKKSLIKIESKLTSFINNNHICGRKTKSKHELFHKQFQRSVF